MTMGINLSGGQNSTNSAMELSLQKENDIAVVQEYDIVAEREKITRALANSSELDALTSQLDVYNPETIVKFGSNVTEEISKCSDVVLNSMSMSQVNDSGEMLTLLSKIMNKFDMKELEEDKGLFGKLFNNAKKQLDKILSKYHTMGEEIDKIYVQLRKYEDEIKQSNRHLENMFQTNVQYYNELVKYILAGEQGIREIDAYVDQKRNELVSSGDNSIQFELTSLEQAKNMLEQRVQDLRVAENVALQSIPMIKTMEFSNYNLVRKIDSAFIITLPVFKQALSQAILLKRQKIQAEAMAALDEKTNEMLLRNAQNTVATSKLTTQLTSTSSIKAETLETTWRTIVQGIEETKAIQAEAQRKREEDKLRLNQIKKEFNEMFHTNV